MAEGRTNAAIGAELFLSPKTIATHVRSIFKLDLREWPEGNRRVLAVLRHLRAS
jgi:DNA-binding NarL/FixJ family response regulator